MYQPTHFPKLISCLAVIITVLAAVAVAFTLSPREVEAKVVTASNSYGGTLYYQAIDHAHAVAPGLYNPHATVHYHVGILNEATSTWIPEGANIPVGTIIQLHTHLGDISWHGTGGHIDTPTGRWVTNAASGEITPQCRGSYYVGTYYDVVEWEKSEFPWTPILGFVDVHIPFSVHPPTRTFSVGGTAGLVHLGGNRYRIDSPGSVTATFTFAETYGRYYYQFRYPSSTCMSRDNMAMLAGHLFPGTTISSYIDDRLLLVYETDRNAFIYNATFPARTVTYTVNVPAPPLPATPGPTNPVITGLGTVEVNTPYSFTFVSTATAANQLYYEIDWTMDGVVNQRVPSAGLVEIEVVQNGTRTWTTAGNTTFQIRAIDQHGSLSDWTSHTVNVTPAPTSLSFEASVSGGAWSASDRTIAPTDTLALRWSSTGMSSCTGTGFTTGGATSNPGLSVTPAPSGTTATFRLDCLTVGGDTVSRTLNVFTDVGPLPSVTVRSRVDGGPWGTGNRTIEPGQVVEMDWTSTHAMSCTGTNAPTVSGTSGAVTLSNPAPGTTDIYGVTCFNAPNVVSSVFTITVNMPTTDPTDPTTDPTDPTTDPTDPTTDPTDPTTDPTDPTTDPTDPGPVALVDITLHAQPAIVRAGNPATLSWSDVPAEASSCDINGPGLDTVFTTGFNPNDSADPTYRDVAITAPRRNAADYQMVCRNADGDVVGISNELRIEVIPVFLEI